MVSDSSKKTMLCFQLVTASILGIIGKFSWEIRSMIISVCTLTCVSVKVEGWTMFPTKPNNKNNTTCYRSGIMLFHLHDFTRIPVTNLSSEVLSLFHFMLRKLRLERVNWQGLNSKSRVEIPIYAIWFPCLSSFLGRGIVMVPSLFYLFYFLIN